MFSPRTLLLSFFVISTVFLFANRPTPASAELTDDQIRYLEVFEKAFPRVETPPTWEDYTAVDSYDSRYMGEALENDVKTVSNEKGGIAWGLSYKMLSLNNMYRATRDSKYLEANLRASEAVLAARDDKTGKPLFTGKIAPIWGCDLYAKSGRAAFAVHTGVIVFPILEFLDLAKQDQEFSAALGAKASAILTGVTEALAFHDRQWQEGPVAGEGNYFALEQEEGLDYKVLPGNRLAAMGLAHWGVWKLNGSKLHEDRARALANYIKNRLPVGEDGGYYWEYWLAKDPVSGTVERLEVNGEDTSHGGLTASFPIRLAGEGFVFDRTDRERFARTFLQGISSLGEGVMTPQINGRVGIEPQGYVWGIARWLTLAAEEPEVRDRIKRFYLERVASPHPLDLSLLILDRMAAAGERKN
jgi:hypothetical protein